MRTKTIQAIKFKTIGKTYILRGMKKKIKVSIKLLEIGISKGALITFIRKDFANNLIQIEVRGSRICITSKQANLLIMDYLK